MYQIRLPRIGALLVLCTAFAAGCGDPPPPPAPLFTIAVGATQPPIAAVVPFNFGQVAWDTSKQQIFTITNSGNDDGVIQGVDTAGLALTNSFTAIDSTIPSGSLVQACIAGATMKPNDSCFVTVLFTPPTTGNYDTTLTVTYTAPGTAPATTTAASDIKIATLELLATSQLDCSVAGAPADATKQGKTAALDQMKAEKAQGEKDGAALSNPQGQKDGKKDGYADGYNLAYHASTGYTAGYNAGVKTGKANGLVDVPTCNSGNSHGSTDGHNAGTNDGAHDGYADGYHDGFTNGAGSGYNDGYSNGIYTGASDGANVGASDGTKAGKSDGYNVGYSVGQTDGYNVGLVDGGNVTCPSTGSTGTGSSGSGSSGSGSNGSGSSGTGGFTGPHAKAPTSDQNLTTCYNQGYNANYNSNAYADGYADAKANNTDYWNGYTAGKATGEASGAVDGKAQGIADGNAKGQQDGFAAGTAIEYTQCYNNTYPSAYAANYKSSYNSSYPTGQGVGIHDAYQAAFTSGYNTAYTIGYNKNYKLNYDSDYSSAYAALYTPGYNDGYDAGYSTGYTDGEDAKCGGSGFTSIASRASRISTAKALHVVTVPTPVIPAQAQSKATTAIFAGSAKVAQALAPVASTYGTGQAWWVAKDIQGETIHVEAYAKSVLPPIVKFTEAQSKAFSEMTNADITGSLRQFLKSQNESARFQGLLVNHDQLKPAVKTGF